MLRSGHSRARRALRSLAVPLKGRRRTERHRLRRLHGDRGPGAAETAARLRRLLDPEHRRTLVAAAVAAALLGALWNGPAAGIVAAVYATAAVLAVRRHRRAARTAHHRERARATVSLLAADLRAGVPAHDAVAAALRAMPDTPDPLCRLARRRLAAAWEVADGTGASCADVLDRLDADLRARARTAARAATRLAGARASIGLIAVLPFAGFALGAGIGGDVPAVLFHTPLGVTCVAAATVLQIAGLLWAERLTAPMEVAT